MAFPQYVTDSTSLYFTTYEEIVQEFSLKGVEWRIDDLSPTDESYDDNNPTDVSLSNYITTLCQRATSHVLSFLAPRFNATDLYQIPRIREIATYFACHKLSKRRGNPALYEQEVIEAEDELELFRSGDRYLTAPSNGPRAYMQSHVVDMRFMQNPSRVIRRASSDVIPNQNESLYVPFWWL